jgi:hypothetical protein
MKRIKLAILVTILLSSCSAQWHLRRALKKDPTIITTKLDSIIVQKDILVTDTFRLSKIDTFTMDTGGVITNIYKYYDTYKITQRIKGDSTFYFTKTIIKEKNPKELKQLMYVFLVMCLLLAGLFFKR